jgi:hypothetical protein
MGTRGQYLRPTPPRRRWMAAAAAVCAAAVLAGCKSSGGGLFNRGGPNGTLMSRGDPLLGGARIPPQNLPLPGRDGYGARERKDPLLGSPAGRDADERAGRDDAKGSASRGWTKDHPFRPGPGTTNAALAGHLVPDDTLSIGDRRAPGRTASQPADDGPEYTRAADELRRLGATVDPPERTGNGYEVRATVPLDGPGLIRQYTGAGLTPAAAVRQLLDQVRSDRAGR